MLRLFGALEEKDTSYRPPTSELELRRRQRLELPVVMSDLPHLLGPHGHLVIVGVGLDGTFWALRALLWVRARLEPAGWLIVWVTRTVLVLVGSFVL